MKYMLLIYADQNKWAEMTPEDGQKAYQLYMQYSQDLVTGGVMVGGSELLPTETAKTLRADGGTVLVTDGPFAETREQLGGYYLINVPDQETAIEWAKKCPGVLHGQVEVRALTGNEGGGQ